MIKIYVLINWLFFFSYWLLIAIVTLRIMIKRRTVSSAMAWLLVIYTIPLVGILTYLLLGELNLGKDRAERSKTLWLYVTQWFNSLKEYYVFFSKRNSEVAQSLFQLCTRRQGISGLKNNQIQLLTNTHSALQSIIQDIALAKNNIEMVFYIWHAGGLIDDVIEELMKAARRGVHCRIMLDSAGSSEFFKSCYPKVMRESGIRVVEALHVSLFRIFLRRMDLRQHRKMILIDGRIAYTGSMNMVDPQYFKQNIGIGQWIDIIVRMEGIISTAMGIIFSCDWEIETGEHILSLPPDFKGALHQKGAEHITQVIASGPGFPENIIHQALLTSVYAAQKRLVITTPYLVPSDDLLRAICTVAQRGVKVCIIVPRYNDSLLVSWASRAFFDELLESGVSIYQFEGGLLHAKSVVVDDQLSLIGTVNLDMRSLWLNLEITLVIDGRTFSKSLACIQESYINQSCLIKQSTWSKRPVWQRVIERIFYFISPLL